MQDDKKLYSVSFSLSVNNKDKMSGSSNHNRRSGRSNRGGGDESGFEVSYGAEQDRFASGTTNTGTRFNTSRGDRKSGTNNNTRTSQPIDLDNGEIFDPFQNGWNAKDDDGLEEFIEEPKIFDKYDQHEYDDGRYKVYADPPELALLNDNVHQIPGSPWAKPASRRSNRPTDPLPIAKHASTIAFTLTIGWVGFLFISAVWNYQNSVGRVIVEMLLAFVSFFGLFWNLYFATSSICKCFIPRKAFQTNTKYCSVIPETKSPNDDWLDVTIQIPVYKESLREVLMPTLKSCMASRNHYMHNTGATCNIVVCDDGMMAFLHDNFAAAEMLWETICKTKGKVVKLSSLMQHVPRPSRRHLKGLKSRAIYEVFHRMLFYYHSDIGFTARSTNDRRGKFKKAGNLNSHLRLAWGAEQLADETLNEYYDGDDGNNNKNQDMEQMESQAFEEALIQVSHNPDGSRYIMFGNNVAVGDLIIVNDADARMAPSVIMKTVPEFLNDPKLGFTQHTTKTMNDQRYESYYINMLSVYTDALYQGHFLLSSILGCHPPLVGHSIFLRSSALQQCGRLRQLRKTQRWLENVGLPFLSVDQVGAGNLLNSTVTEYWSECHVSEDFELMIHLYNLGFDGRYIAYPGCEFQEGITRTFDEEAGRHRKFALGAHELMFNPVNSWIGQGVFSPLFKTFLTCDIPSYYKIFLTAYLLGYTSGGAYILVFVAAAVTRILDRSYEVDYIHAFNSAGVLILSMVIYYVIGYLTFLISMVRMYFANRNLLFPEYRNRSVFYLIYMKIRYSMFFQLMFYSCMGNFFYLGSMDHLLSKPGVVSATNKDSIKLSRCVALFEVIKFNSGSWFIALSIIGLAYATLIEPGGWIPTVWEMDHPIWESRDSLLYGLLFAAPATLMASMAFIVPLIFNPYVVGCPFHPPICRRRLTAKDMNPYELKGSRGDKTVDLNTFMKEAQALDKEMKRTEGKPDVEIGSLGTNDFGSKYPLSIGTAPATGFHTRRGSSSRSKGRFNLNDPYGLGETKDEAALGNAVYNQLITGTNRSGQPTATGQPRNHHYRSSGRPTSNGAGGRTSGMNPNRLRDSTNTRQSRPSSGNNKDAMAMI